MPNDRFNPDMLQLARDARELTQSELATASGVTQALISKLEHGLITEPSEQVILAFSDTLKFPTEFFYQQERAIGFPHFHYRRRAKMGKKELARIEAIINIRRQHLAKLMRSYEEPIEKPIPQYDLDVTGTTPEKIAEQIRAYWMIPRGPIDNMVEIIEQGGGIVISVRMGTAQLDGVSFRSAGLPPLFFMNREMPADRFRFSLTHELGHMILHAIPGDDKTMEDEAHRFAAEFLMPATEIRPYLREAKLSAFARVKKYWKVSIKALIKRAYDLKVITDYQYKMLNIQYNKTYKSGEPGEFEHEKPSRLRRIFNYHVQTLGYSLGEMAKLLCFREEDVSRLYLDRPRLSLVT